MRDDDEQQLKIELLSQWKLEAESRNLITDLVRWLIDFTVRPSFQWKGKSIYELCRTHEVRFRRGLFMYSFVMH